MKPTGTRNLHNLGYREQERVLSQLEAWKIRGYIATLKGSIDELEVRRDKLVAARNRAMVAIAALENANGGELTDQAGIKLHPSRGPRERPTRGSGSGDAG